MGHGGGKPQLGANVQPIRIFVVALACVAVCSMTAQSAADAPVDAAETNASAGVAQPSLDVADEKTSLAQLLPKSLRRKSAQTGQAKRSPLRKVERRVEVIQKGRSSRSARKAARAAVPLDLLNRDDRKRAEKLLRSISVFRELPIIASEVEPDVYSFFVSHPDVAVSIWRSLGISDFAMLQTGPNQYESDAGDGTSGVVDVLYRSPEESILYCDGQFKSPFLSKPIRARALMHLQAVFWRTDDGKPHVKHRLNLFVHFPSVTVQAAARLISPVGNRIADRNFHEVSEFLHMMSTAMSRHPGWVEQLAGNLDGVLEIRKTQLRQVTTRVHVAAQKRNFAEAPRRTRTSAIDTPKPKGEAGKQSAGTVRVASAEEGE